MLFVTVTVSLLFVIALFCSRKTKNKTVAKLFFSIFTLFLAIFCLDGYERAEPLITSYFAGGSISEAESGSLFKSLGLGKYAIPALFLGVSVTLFSEVVSKFLND